MFIYQINSRHCQQSGICFSLIAPNQFVEDFRNSYFIQGALFCPSDFRGILQYGKDTFQFPHGVNHGLIYAKSIGLRSAVVHQAGYVKYQT